MLDEFQREVLREATEVRRHEHFSYVSFDEVFVLLCLVEFPWLGRPVELRPTAQGPFPYLLDDIPVLDELGITIRIEEYRPLRIPTLRR